MQSASTAALGSGNRGADFTLNGIKRFIERVEKVLCDGSMPPPARHIVTDASTADSSLTLHPSLRYPFPSPLTPPQPNGSRGQHHHMGHYRFLWTFLHLLCGTIANPKDYILVRPAKVT